MTVELCTGPGTSTFTSDRYACLVNGSPNYVVQWDTQLANNVSTEGNMFDPMKKCMTKWGCDELVELSVSLIDGSGPITSYEMLPHFDDVSAGIDGGVLILEVPAGRKFRLHVNGNKLDPLFVTSGPLASAIPAGATEWGDWLAAHPGQGFIEDGTVIYFPPGEHTIPQFAAPPYDSVGIIAGDNCTFYFDRDAVVDGRFYLGVTDNTVFRGPGYFHNVSSDPEDVWDLILGGATFDEQSFYALFTNSGGPFLCSCTLQEMTLFGSAFGCVVGGVNKIEDATFICYSRGGIGTGPDVRPRLVDGKSFLVRSLIDAGDDAVFATAVQGNTLIEDCSIGTNLNSTVHLGYWGYTSGRTDLFNNPGPLVKDCHLYHLGIADNDTEVGYPSRGDTTVFGCRVDASEATALAGSGHYNVKVRDCRIYGTCNARVIWLRNELYPYDVNNQFDAAGNIGYFEFTNLVVDELPPLPSYIVGRDIQNTPHDIWITGMTIDGTPVTSANFSTYFTTNSTVYNLFVDLASSPGFEQTVGPKAHLLPSQRHAVTINGVPNFVLDWTHTCKTATSSLQVINQPITDSMCVFGSDASVTLQVTLVDGDGPVTDYELLPNFDDVTPSIVSGKLQLVIPAGRKFMVILNGRRSKPLHIMANPLQEAVPVGSVSWPDWQAANPGLFYFPSGTKIHFPAGEWNSGFLMLTGSGCTFHYDRDAVVKGNFYLGEGSGNRFIGNGYRNGLYATPNQVLGLGFSQEVLYSAFTDIGGSLFYTDNESDGPTLYGFPTYSVYGGINTFRGNVITYRQRFVGYGVTPRPGLLSQDSLIEDSYICAGDDAVQANYYNGKVTLRNSTVMTDQSACLHFNNFDAPPTLDTAPIVDGSHFVHLGLADTDTDTEYPIRGSMVVFRGWMDGDEGRGLLGWGRDGVSFVGNNRVYGPLRCRLFHIGNLQYPYSGVPQDDAAGNQGFWTWESLVVDETPQQLSYLFGRDALNTPHDFTIDNWEIGGVAVNTGNWSDFVIQNEFPYNIFINGEEYLAFTLEFSGLSYRIYTADGAASTYPIVIDYLEEEHLVVMVNGVVKTAGVHYNITAGSVVFTAGNIPSGGDQVKIVRQTPAEYSEREVDFQSYGAITEDQMDRNQKQTWLLIQEAKETADTGEIDPEAEYIFWDSSEDEWSAEREGNPQRIANVADPTGEQDAATKAYVDNVAEWGSAGTPQSWEFTASGSTNVFQLTGGADLDADYLVVSVAGVPMSPLSDFTTNPKNPDSSLILTVTPTAGQKVAVQNFGKARFINTLVPGTNSVATTALQDLSVTSQKLAEDAVTASKLATSSVTADALAPSSVNSVSLADGSINELKLAPVFLADAPLVGTQPAVFTMDPDTGAPVMRRLTPLDLEYWIEELQNVPLNTFANPTAPRNMGAQRITNLGAPSSSTDAATKAYVDSQVGSAVGNKVDLLFQNELASPASTWLWIDKDASAPSWWTDSNYLYYTVVVHGLSGGTISMNVWRGAGSGWETPNGHTAIAATTVDSVVSKLNFLGILHPPRTPFSQHMTGWFPGSFGDALVTRFPGSAITGLRLSSTGTIAAGATVQIYGHKAL